MPSNSRSSSSSEEGVQQELQRLGVRLLAREDVEAMLRASCQVLGEGKQGSCVLSVDPDTQQKVVIKTFKQRKLDAFLVEVRNLQRFASVPGVQRLVGVCLDTNQEVTLYAGCTVGQYFQQPVPFSRGVTVFLQLARAVQAILARGYTHNDLKKENLCVRDTSAGPVATIIDLGIASPVGTLRVFKGKSHPEDFPSQPPELHTHTHPTSEASDAYRFAYSVKEALRLRPGAPHAPPVVALMRWLEAALLPDPAQRPPFAALVRALEVLQEEALSVSPPRLSRTEQQAGGEGENECERLKRRRQSESGEERMKTKRESESTAEQSQRVKRRRVSESGEERMKRKRETESTEEQKQRVKRRRVNESSMERKGEEECASSGTGRVKRKLKDESGEEHKKRKRDSEAGDNTTTASLEKKRRKGTKNRRQRRQGGSSQCSSRCED